MISHYLDTLTHILIMAFGMFWQVGWSLVLGFFISACIQVLVPTSSLQRHLGRNGIREVGLATVAGALSSSCSFASAAVSRTLFQKGAGLVPTLAFLFASTNLVLELGLVLLLLLGWPFMAAEWLGGILLIVILSILVGLTYPKALVEAARRHCLETGSAMPADPSIALSFRERLCRPDTFARIARHFVVDWQMLWKDIAMGFLIAGALSVLVPDELWQTIFIQHAPPITQSILNAFIGPLVAVVSFVCAIGNVPMAAVLWGSGVSFGGVLAFLYADLIILPLLNVYRRDYGWKMAAYMGVIFYLTMAVSGLLMEWLFSVLGWLPHHNPMIRGAMVHFAFNYTFWLNVAFTGLATALVWHCPQDDSPNKPSCCH